MLEWKRGTGGWVALVLYVVDVDDGPDAQTVVQQWMSSDLLTPLEGAGDR